MNVITELQREILDQSISISTILRKAKVLASEMKNDDFKNWIEKELNGYDYEFDEIPQYRIGGGENYGHFWGFGGAQLQNAPIPTLNLEEPVREFASKTMFHQSAKELETMVEDTSSNLKIAWPADFIAISSDKIYEKFKLAAAWKSVSKLNVIKILETIRNRLLNFVLELQELYPKLKESDNYLSEVPKDRFKNVVNTYIFGNSNVVATGHNLTQFITIKVIKNDLESLKKYLVEIGGSVSDINTLEKAITEDGPPDNEGQFGKKVSEWFGETMKKVSQGVWKIAVPKAATLLTKAIFNYYGW